MEDNFVDRKGSEYFVSLIMPNILESPDPIRHRSEKE